jgi:hypothetical protein
MLSVVIGVASTFKKKSIISPGFDGGLYGFTAAFAILYFATTLASGYLPMP